MPSPKRLPSCRAVVLGASLNLMFAPLALRAAEVSPLQPEPAKVGAPVNPFIYGQFIEHLGRCIYGGIWAEMLEDRKFYFPVTGAYAPYKGLTDTAYPVVGASPWAILGAAEGVTMVKEGAFVGDHSPRLAAGVAVQQRDLGVVAGKQYVGYFWAKPATAKGKATVEVALGWGEGAGQGATQVVQLKAGDYTRQAFTFTAGATTDRATLTIKAAAGDVVLGTVSLMPGDNVRGMRRDTLALLKQLGGTIYRWPGGNFTSGYDWHDGIGDRDRRPPRKNPAWTGVEHNDFGTDEFIDFCREVGTVPMIAANAGFGDAYSAAQWVEYCNGATSTLAGSWRAKNGHKQPYDVKHWCVGNEMFGTWQLGFMQLHQYAIKHNLFVEAMRRVDPTLVLAAVGDIETINKDNDPEQVKRGVTWSHGMLLDCADHMDILSEHFYEGRLPWKPEIGLVETVEHAALLKNTIRRRAEAHRKLQASLPNLKGRTIPITMDEWNYWHREYLYGELGCPYDLADALGVAAGLHEYYRQSDIVQMAFYAQTVNVIGAIKTTRTAAEMESTGLVLQMYRAHFGTLPLQIEQAWAPCDVAAALSADRKTLTIAIVNPTTGAVAVPVAWPAGLKAKGNGTRWSIGGSDARAHNTPGQPRVIDIATATDVASTAPLAAAPLSATIYSFPVTE